MRVQELKKSITKTKPKAEVEEMIKKLRKEHEKLVKGKFEFIDAQGGWLDFTFRFFPGDPVMTIHLDHGEECELPMGIVKHLNNAKKKIRRVNTQILEHGNKAPPIFETISRVRFTPVEYL